MKINVKALIALILVAVLGLWTAITWISVSNGEKTRYNAIEQMSENRENLFDSMWKQIKQTAQIAEKEKEGMKELVTGFMEGRQSVNGEKAFFSMLHEAYPNLPQLSYSKIMNVVTGKRDEFQRYQTELKDRCRDYKDYTQIFPNSLFTNGRDITEFCKVISSAESQEVMKTKQENNIDVF